MTDGIRHVGVVGLGVMGFDIAFLYAMKGYPTWVYDASAAAMESVAARTEGTIERLQRRDRIGKEEAEHARGGLHCATGIPELARADLVTEAVSESCKTKTAVYQALHQAGFEGVLTTNTSSFTQASLSSSGAFDEARFATTHFFNPVLHTRMVEVVQGRMREELFAATLAFLEDIGRMPTRTRDISGFVSNSILMYYAVAALWLLERGATIEAVDQAAGELGLLPPFLSFDSWKPSIVEDVTQIMYELRGDAFLRSSPLLTRLARDNPRFYVERQPNSGIYELLGTRPPGLGAALIRRVLMVTIRAAAARTVELGEDQRTVDYVAVQGVRIPNGPLADIDAVGPAAVVREVAAINRELGEARLPVPHLLAAMARDSQTFFSADGSSNPLLKDLIEREADS